MSLTYQFHQSKLGSWLRTIHFIMITVLICSIAESAFTQQPAWVRRLSGSGLGNPFCVNPLNDNIIYGSTANSYLRISRDRGTTWQTLAYLTGGSQIKSVAVSARDTNMILVAQEAGPPDRIMKTTDHGYTWVQTLSKDTYFYGVPLAYNPASASDTVYTMGSNVVWRSTNFGTTWDSLCSSPFGTANQGWEFAIIRPDSTNILIAADYGSGIWKSTDYGSSWHNTHYTSVEIPALAFTPSNPKIVYGARWGGGGGFVKSTDGGGTWAYCFGLVGLNLWGVSVSKTDPNFVMTGTYGPSLETSGGIYFSRDAGDTWERSYQGLVNPPNYACLVLDTLTILVLQNDGIWKFTYPIGEITLTSPIGGEVWYVNSSHNITWDAANVSTVKIEYTTNNGIAWNTIASDIDALTGSYNWVLPNTPSSNCRVRVSDTLKDTIVDQSSATFTMMYSAVSLIHPNGGEIFQSGSKENITWTSINVSSVKLQYTTDDGNNWLTIVPNTPSAPGSYGWSVPYSTSSICKIRIVDLTNVLTTDTSDTFFTITDSSQFSSELVISDAGGNIDTLLFGESAGATDNIDPIFGEVELLPKPGIDTFDVRWRIQGTNGTARDFRGTMSMSNLLCTYTIELQPGPSGYPFTLRWRPESLPSGDFILQDELTQGSEINSDMRSESLHVVTNNSISSIRILHYYATTLPVPVMNRWNMVSVPLDVRDGRKTVVFSPATSVAYAYSHSYVQKETLEIGSGYWLKFSGDQFIPITGRPCSGETLNVGAGWNMIGSITQPVLVSNIISDPPFIVSSRYFGYRNGYYEADTINPGRGYWIKINQSGKLLLSSNSLNFPRRSDEIDFKTLNILTISDQQGHSQSLYFGISSVERLALIETDMPPLPPAGSFDARFSTNQYIEMIRNEESKTIPISITSATFPLIISWNIKDCALGTSLLRTQDQDFVLTKEGQISIQNPAIKLSLLLSGNRQKTSPTEFLLESNFPNPFNPRTILSYQLPVKSHVTLKIYNTVGQLVNILVNNIEEAGFKTIVWDAGKHSSGIYLCRLEAVSASEPKRVFIQAKKMLYLK